MTYGGEQHSDGIKVRTWSSVKLFLELSGHCKRPARTVPGLIATAVSYCADVAFRIIFQGISSPMRLMVCPSAILDKMSRK